MTGDRDTMVCDTTRRRPQQAVPRRVRTPSTRPCAVLPRSHSAPAGDASAPIPPRAQTDRPMNPTTRCSGRSQNASLPCGLAVSGTSAGEDSSSRTADRDRRSFSQSDTSGAANPPTAIEAAPASPPCHWPAAPRPPATATPAAIPAPRHPHLRTQAILAITRANCQQHGQHEMAYAVANADADNSSGRPRHGRDGTNDHQGRR